MAASGLYRNSAIGECLDEALTELLEKDKLNGEVKEAALKQVMLLVDFSMGGTVDNLQIEKMHAATLSHPATPCCCVDV